jgi:monofunctional biosynthetic peptidoglycan transglycosylase
VLNESILQLIRNTAKRSVNWSKVHWIQVTLIVVLAFVVEQVATLPFGDVASLAKMNPTRTAFMELQADLAKQNGKRFTVFQRWLPLKDIPKDVVNAVIVSEDGTFWSHQGFDWFELRESIGRNIEEGRAARGASTITQQLVKNLYLSPSKNPLRKMKEWILTWWMEQRLRKSRILEIYLNVIEWGDGVYGIDAASQYHFGKPAMLLTRDEAARLAAIIPDPRDHMAGSDSQYVVKRSALILDRMEARGF